MNVTLEADGPCRQTLTIDVPAETVQAEFETVTGEFMREARIPGFRPGRAPRALVEKRFAKPIAEQVRDRLMPKYYQQALKQEKIEPVSVINVDPEETAPQQPWRFKVTVDLPPSFELPDYRHIELTDETAAITDHEIDETVLNLRRRQARYPDVERPAADRDLVFFDYDGALDGQPLDTDACREVGSGRDVAMLMDREREILPGFFDGLQGVVKDEERTIDVTFPSDYHVPEVADKTVQYTVRVKTVREEQLPELDAEFFKLFDVTDEPALRAKLKTGLEANARDNEKKRRMDAILRHLMDNASIETLPESLVTEENRAVMQEVVQDFLRQGVDRDAIAQRRDEITQMAEQTSKERVKINAILDRIANIEKIEATNDDFQLYLASMAARYGITVEKALKSIKQREATDTILSHLRRSKTSRFLMEQNDLPGNDPTADADTPSTEEESTPS